DVRRRGRALVRRKRGAVARARVAAQSGCCGDRDSAVAAASGSRADDSSDGSHRRVGMVGARASSLGATYAALADRQLCHPLLVQLRLTQMTRGQAIRQVRGEADALDPAERAEQRAMLRIFFYEHAIEHAARHGVYEG